MYIPDGRFWVEGLLFCCSSLLILRWNGIIYLAKEMLYALHLVALYKDRPR